MAAYHRHAKALGDVAQLQVDWCIRALATLILGRLGATVELAVAAMIVGILVGVTLGVPVAPLAFLLLFATNFFSANTPQGSSANLLFAGSGYLTQGGLYRLGAFTTAFNLAVYLVVGLPWLLLVAR